MKTLILIILFSVPAIASNCAGSQMNGYIGTDSTYMTRIPYASVDISRKDFGFWVYQDTVYSQYDPGGGDHGLWTYYGDECAEYKAHNVVIPGAFLPCALNRKVATWEFLDLGYPHPWFGTQANFHCI